MSRYDLVAIGTGTAGSHVAFRCRAAGWRVAVVDDRPFGGTCALRGCEPKKTLWTIAEAVDRAHRLTGKGIVGAPGIAVDWPALMAFKRTFTDPVPARRAASYRDAGIDAFDGTARFVGPNAIAVGDRVLQARHVLIATGARPVALPIEGAGHLLTSDDMLELEALPGRIVMVGGGYISFELGHIAARAGARVTILQEDQRPLAQFDPDLVDRLVAHTRAIGIAVELGAEVTRVVRTLGAKGVRVEIEGGRAVEGDIAVHGLGRKPDLDALDLAAGGVTVEKGRLVLDAQLRSVSNPAVFAAGDAAARGPALTPIATLDADCVARNLLDGARHAPDYAGAASAVFTIPPLAMAGLTEAKARESGFAVDVRAGDMADYQSVRREGHRTAAYKVILERGRRRLLGAHLLGPDAHETINLFALAIRLGLGADGLERLLSAYPSGASNIGSMLR